MSQQSSASSKKNYEDLEWINLLDNSKIKHSEHWKSSVVWTIIYYTLNISGIVLSGIITADGMNDMLSRELITIIGLTSMIITSLTTMLNPGSKYDIHKKNSKTFDKLYYSVKRCDDMERFVDLQEEYIRLEYSAPPVSVCCKKMKKEKVIMNPILQKQLDEYYNKYRIIRTSMKRNRRMSLTNNNGEYDESNEYKKYKPVQHTVEKMCAEQPNEQYKHHIIDGIENANRNANANININTNLSIETMPSSESTHSTPLYKRNAIRNRTYNVNNNRPYKRSYSDSSISYAYGNNRSHDNGTNYDDEHKYEHKYNNYYKKNQSDIGNDVNNNGLLQLIKYENTNDKNDIGDNHDEIMI